MGGPGKDSACGIPNIDHWLYAYKDDDFKSTLHRDDNFCALIVCDLHRCAECRSDNAQVGFVLDAFNVNGGYSKTDYPFREARSKFLSAINDEPVNDGRRTNDQRA